MKEEFIIKVLDRAMQIISMDQAQKLRLILEEELYNYDLQAATVALVPLNNILDRVKIFLAAKKLDGLSDISLSSYKRALYKFSSAFQKDLESIGAMDIRMYLAAYSKSGVKNASVATLISILKSFFSWLENEEYILKSPLRKIKNIKTDKFIRKALTAVELEMLRDSAEDPRDKAMIEFFYSTGCRLDEAQKLNKGDIDWNSGKVIVFGKGSKERPVFLNAKAKVYLWKYLNTRTDHNEALFVSERRPYGRLGRKSFQTTFDRLGKKAGITKDVYPHLLRHTTATSMLQNGASLAEVQKLLGHTSPATTQIYAQLDIDELQASHKKHVI